MRGPLRVLRGGKAGPRAGAPPTAEPGGQEAPHDFDWLDVLALTIAAFQVILPVLAAFAGVVLALYLLLRWWAG